MTRGIKCFEKISVTKNRVRPKDRSRKSKMGMYLGVTKLKTLWIFLWIVNDLHLRATIFLPVSTNPMYILYNPSRRPLSRQPPQGWICCKTFNWTMKLNFSMQRRLGTSWCYKFSTPCWDRFTHTPALACTVQRKNSLVSTRWATLKYQP